MMLPMIIVNKWMEHGKNQVIDFVQVHDQSLEAFVQKICHDMTLCAPGAVAASKRLIEGVAGKTIDDELIAYTARELAKVRVTDECKEGFSALIEKRKPAWTKAGPMSAKL